MKAIIRFLKNWTLPVSMAFGAVAYLVFASVPALDETSKLCDSAFNYLLPFSMFLILFVTFCKVDFRKMRVEAWHLWIILLQVLFVSIMVAVIKLWATGGEGKIMCEGILTCIIGPTAAAAAVVTVKLGGTLNSMTTYTFLSSFVTAVLIPLFFPMIEKEAHMPFFTAFFIILYKVVIVLVVPLLLGWLVRHYTHKLYKAIVSVNNLGFYMWGLTLAIVTGTTVKNICHAGTSVGFILAIAVLSLVLCLVQFAIGKFVGRFFHATINAGQALGQKNTAFAIWIATAYLNPLASVGPGCYILWQNLVNSWELWEARQKVKE